MENQIKERRKKRAVTEGVKIGSNALISLTLVAVLILADMFTLDNFKIEMAKASYWMTKILSTAGTYCLMIAFSNIVEGAKTTRDSEFNTNLDTLDQYYDEIMNNGFADNLEKFILYKNKNNKYKAFIEHYKAKLKKYDKLLVRYKKTRYEPKITAQRDYCKEMLIKSVDEVWDEENIKYQHITTPQLFSGATDVPSKFGEDDIQVRKGYFAGKKLITKALMLLLGSFSISDLVYSFGSWDKSMIIPLILRIIVILIAIYSGICFGSFIVERMKVTLKTKLKILSQFRARQKDTTLKDDARFVIEPEKDLVVEKCKSELTPFKQTISKTFGAGQPVKIGGFVKELVQNTIDYEANKQVENN